LGTIKVGLNAEYPPFESVDENGNIVGFDPDIMSAIADAAGFEYELVNTRWDGIFVALASGEFDAVISAATITPERQETVDFSDPYFNAGQMLAVQIGNDEITSPADLDGKKVGVQLGTTGDIWATDNTGAEVIRYDEITLAFQALANGDIDAVLNDGPTSADLIKANPELGVTLVGEPFTDEFYGIAVNKDRPEVLAAINEGLDIIQESGQYDEIYEKWFGTPEVGEGEAEGEALMVYEAPNCDYGGEFLKMEALDELTVRFTLCAPDVAFPSKVAFSAFAIQSSDYLQETGGGGDIVDNPVGTGPYKIQEWRRGEQLIMERNPDYWGEAAIADTLVFRWSTEGAQRLLELQSGAVDGIDNPSPDDFATIEADDNLTLYPREALNIFYLGMNNRFPPFDDEMVRQAIAMGIDRQRIVDNFYPGGSTVASHFTPCAIPGGCEGEEWYAFDVEAAQAMLAEAGYPDGFSTEIAYRDVFRSYLPEPGLVAQDIQAQLKNNLGSTCWAGARTIRTRRTFWTSTLARERRTSSATGSRTSGTR
jgi:ABC-type amino acid transport substrate-binding protein